MPDFLRSPLMYLCIIPVATSNHPLHQLGRTLRLEDLHGHRHLVIRESGSKRNTNVLSIDVSQRWTVSNAATSIEAIQIKWDMASRGFPKKKSVMN